MSRKRYEGCVCRPYQPTTCGCNTGNVGGSCFGLPMLVVLILIVLQFGKNKNCKVDYQEDDHCDEDYDYDECDDHEESYKKGCDSLVDNGILFIIALFYLACCGKKFC